MIELNRQTCHMLLCQLWSTYKSVVHKTSCTSNQLIVVSGSFVLTKDKYSILKSAVHCTL